MGETITTTPLERARFIVRTEPENLQRAIQEQIEEAMQELLSMVGRGAICQGCRCAVFYVLHQNGKQIAYSRQGMPHSEVCAEALAMRNDTRKRTRRLPLDIPPRIQRVPNERP